MKLSELNKIKNIIQGQTCYKYYFKIMIFFNKINLICIKLKTII